MATPVLERSKILGDEYVDDEALQREFKVGPRTTRKWRQQGAPHVKFGQQIRYHVPTFRKWLLTEHGRGE